MYDPVESRYSNPSHLPSFVENNEDDTKYLRDAWHGKIFSVTQRRDSINFYEIVPYPQIGVSQREKMHRNKKKSYWKKHL